jgi:hypothetical protein
MVEKNGGKDYAESKMMKMRMCSNEYQTMECSQKIR